VIEEPMEVQEEIVLEETLNRKRLRDDGPKRSPIRCEVANTAML